MNSTAVQEIVKTASLPFVLQHSLPGQITMWLASTEDQRESFLTRMRNNQPVTGSRWNVQGHFPLGESGHKFKIPGLSGTAPAGMKQKGAKVRKGEQVGWGRAVGRPRMGTDQTDGTDEDII